LTSGTNLIGLIRERHPKVVFCIYTDKAEFESRRNELPDSWRSHYYKLFREEDDPSAEFEPVVRASLFRAECEAAYNATHEPIRLTPVFTRGLSAPDNELSGGSDGNIAFVSYARRDWDEFVCKLVSDLAKESYRVWIDQNYLVGGDDWMDAIGQALQICDKLLLIISPDSVISKYVKMEYRYFFKQDKPIIPILYKKVDHIPFEIATLHHIDFTHADRSRSYQELIRILPRQRR
jgi:hypothetical protein